MLNVSFLFILPTCSTVADKSPHLHLQPDLSKKSCNKRLYLILKFLSLWEVVTLPPITPLPPAHSTLPNPPPPIVRTHTGKCSKVNEALKRNTHHTGGSGQVGRSGLPQKSPTRRSRMVMAHALNGPEASRCLSSKIGTVFSIVNAGSGGECYVRALC